MDKSGRIGRRAFLRGLAGAGLLALGGGAAWAEWWSEGQKPPAEAGTLLPGYAREAMYYSGLEAGLDCGSCHTQAVPSRSLYCHVPHQGQYVLCRLCPHQCVLAEGERGKCRVRENRSGRLYTFAYGNPCTVHVDPIEKKPFYHFLPGTLAFSLATAGCSLRCQYCQNYTISQVPPEETDNLDAPPEAVVRATGQEGAPTIAYTYSEPMVFYEYMLDTARLGRQAGLRSVVVSSGYVNPDPFRELCRTVDAIKIDLKGVNEAFYREVCGGTLAPVLEAIRIVHDMGVHLEIVNLVVPTLNDADDEMKRLVAWVLANVGPDIPLHFSRFHPDYQLTNLSPTPVETLDAARAMALEAGLHFVYVGNVPGDEGNHTYCPNCGQLIIRRANMATEWMHLTQGKCGYCQWPIPGVWS